MPKISRSAPSDAGTRDKLLRAAATLFAAHGLEGVTAKEIAQGAEANPAGVNYHFGGVMGLYEAVLAEARDITIAGDRRIDILQGPMAAEEKLRATLTLAVKALLLPGDMAWVAQLLGREVMRPTEAGERILGQIIRDRVDAVRSFVSDFVGLPPDDPRVDLACVSITGPLHMLLIRDRKLLTRLHPALPLAAQGEATLIDHFHDLILSILQRLKADAAGDAG